jgi:hypothetical protein
MPRRVVRSHAENPSEIPAVTSESWIIFSLKKLLSCIRWSTSLVWGVVKVLWYWVERLFFLLFLIILIGGLAWWLSQKPSNLRDWLPSESILQEVSWSGDIVTIQNIRNHEWKTDQEFTP